MANIILFIFLLFFLKTTIEKKENEYKIQVIDDLISSNYIIPVKAQNDSLYLITGENKKSISSNNTYKRVILKYDINSGKIISNFNINSEFPFENPEIVYAGDNLEEYLLTLTSESIGLYNFNKNKETIYPTTDNRRFLKKGDNFFYYGYTNPLLKKDKQIIINQLQLIKEEQICEIYEYNRRECGYLGIDQFICENRGCCWKPIEQYDPDYDFPWCFFGENVNPSNHLFQSPFYKLVKYGNDINVETNQTMISCDFTQNYLYLVCVSISKNFFTISIFNNDIELINSYKKEICSSFQKDDFIKIINFNGAYDFISLNSIDDVTTRLRYFRYDGKNYNSKIDSITNNNNEYLDIQKTQNSRYNYDNDIIVLNKDSIIQISTKNSILIITIFQFYKDNNILFVRIHHLDNMINSGLNFFSNPRLSLFKNNSILLCFSTIDNNEINRTGYFVFDYPNSNDINLTSNIIKINELIYLPNKLYSLDLKLRVLKIPKDFILLNKFDNIEIKENIDLNSMDELILRQYRINEGVFLIKFQGVAVGYDNSYSNWRLYPEIYLDYRKLLEPTQFVIEGNEGNIYINFSDCLQGYHHLEYDYNLCTNIKPKGYYLDNETNTYRACHSHCSECYGDPINSTYMECITCIDGYNITEDTNSCYDYLPIQYYLDGNIFRRCHIRCKTCFTAPSNNSMNCLSCITSEYFYKVLTYSCILPSDFDKREEQDLNKQSNWAFIVFILIFLGSIFITLFIRIDFFSKKKDDIQVLETELKNIKTIN